ncbi:MAG: hypothetical protein AB7I25_05975 [Vicinamibacterales bacterium]
MKKAITLVDDGLEPAVPGARYARIIHRFSGLLMPGMPIMLMAMMPAATDTTPRTAVPRDGSAWVKACPDMNTASLPAGIPAVKVALPRSL